jgi:glycosyltransferase involved in cell wall biosynthesis
VYRRGAGDGAVGGTGAARSPEVRIAEIAPPWFTLPPRGYGGIELIVSELAARLTAAGHEVTLFAAQGSRSPAPVVSRLTELPDPRELGNPWIDAAHALGAFRRAAAFDVIHDHSGIAGLALAGALDGPPVVHTVHGAWTRQNRELYRLAADRVGLVAISHAQQRGNPDLPYLGVAYNGVNVDAYPFEAAKRDGLAFIGRACPDKGPDEAIRIARAAGRPLTMIVKRSEPAEEQYWDRAVRPLLGDDVTVLRDVDHATKVSVLGGAAALLFPIQWEEPFGLVLVEALACGTPVVARALGAATEIVRSGSVGFLGSRTDELVEAVRRGGEIDPLECRRVMTECFSADRMAERYEAIFSRVVARHDPLAVG